MPPRDFGSFRIPASKKKAPRSKYVRRASEESICVYCPNKIRPGMPIVKDFQADAYVHLGCFRRMMSVQRIAREDDTTK